MASSSDSVDSKWNSCLSGLGCCDVACTNAGEHGVSRAPTPTGEIMKPAHASGRPDEGIGLLGRHTFHFSALCPAVHVPCNRNEGMLSLPAHYSSLFTCVVCSHLLLVRRSGSATRRTDSGSSTLSSPRGQFYVDRKRTTISSTSYVSSQYLCPKEAHASETTVPRR